MNIRHILLYTLTAATAQHVHAINASQLDDKQFQQDCMFWALRQYVHAQELNDGYQLHDCDHGIIQFIRDHADEIGKELHYSIEHNNAQRIHALHYDALSSVITFIKNEPFDTETTLANILQGKPAQQALTELLKHWETFKQISLQQWPSDTCPITHHATQLVHAFAETAFVEFLPIIMKYASQTDIPVLPKKFVFGDMLNSLPVIMELQKAHINYIISAESKQLQHQIVTAWVAVMHDETFFKALETLHSGTSVLEVRDIIFELPSVKNFIQLCFSYLQKIDEVRAKEIEKYFDMLDAMDDNKNDTDVA